jgi:hypothetical protein
MAPSFRIKSVRQSRRLPRSGGTPLVVAEKTRGALGVIELKDIVKGGIRDRFRPRSSSHQIIAEHDEKNRIPQRNTLLCHRRSQSLSSLLALAAHALFNHQRLPAIRLSQSQSLPSFPSSLTSFISEMVLMTMVRVPFRLRT